MPNYREILEHLAPCGLDCSRCADYEQGEIKEFSALLLDRLGNYGRLARLKMGMNPLFAGYSQFEDLLKQFSRVSCLGCRNGRNQCPFDCKIVACCKEKGVDFCFQCPDYPYCEEDLSDMPYPERRKTSTRPTSWRANNDRMKAVGVVEFYQEQLSKPRY